MPAAADMNAVRRHDHQPPRTLGECRRAGMHLLIGCSVCRTQRRLLATQICRAFDGWTIDELDRAAVFTCPPPCAEPPALMLYGLSINGVAQLERWRRGEEGFVRPPPR